MCLISLKMQNERYNDVLRMDGKKLFDRATKCENVVFFKFHQWLEREVNKVIQLWRFKRHLVRKKREQMSNSSMDWVLIN